MARILYILIVIFFSNFSYAEISNETRNKYFYVGKMKSYNSQFTLYFKTRDKAVLAEEKMQIILMIIHKIYIFIIIIQKRISLY